MRPASAKAKGRRLQQYLRDRILDVFKGVLRPDDVRSTSMGAGGEDLLLSPLARDCFPYAPECKNVERLNVWAGWDQAKANAGEYEAILVVKRNRSDVLAVISLDHLLEMRRELEAHRFITDSVPQTGNLDER